MYYFRKQKKLLVYFFKIQLQYIAKILINYWQTSCTILIGQIRNWNRKDGGLLRDSKQQHHAGTDPQETPKQQTTALKEDFCGAGAAEDDAARLAVTAADACAETSAPTRPSTLIKKKIKFS